MKIERVARSRSTAGSRSELLPVTRRRTEPGTLFSGSDSVRTGGAAAARSVS